MTHPTPNPPNTPTTLRLLYILYQLCIALPLILVATILTSLVTTLGCATRFAHFWAYWPPRLWSWLVIRVLLLPVQVEGQQNIDPRTSYVFVANHQGDFDIFLIYAFLGHSFRWMMKKSLRNIPLVGKACESSGQIFVDKSGPKAIHRTYEKACRILQGGTSLMVFPEGARTFTGHMGLFRKGAFQLADELQLPVVPLTLDGPFDVLPRMARSPFPHWHRLTLRIHPPIYPIGKGKENEQYMLGKAYDAIMKGLPTDRQGYVKNEDQ